MNLYFHPPTLSPINYHSNRYQTYQSHQTHFIFFYFLFSSIFWIRVSPYKPSYTKSISSSSYKSFSAFLVIFKISILNSQQLKKHEAKATKSHLSCLFSHERPQNAIIFFIGMGGFGNTYYVGLFFKFQK